MSWVVSLLAALGVIWALHSAREVLHRWVRRRARPFVVDRPTPDPVRDQPGGGRWEVVWVVAPDGFSRWADLLEPDGAATPPAGTG